MKKNIWNQFQFRIIALFLALSLFALVVSIEAGNVNLEKAQDQLLIARQNNLKMLVKQYDTDLAAAENYIRMLLYGNNIYAALEFEETSTLYQQARAWLRDELDDTLMVLSLISGFYVRIPQTDDGFLVKESEIISIELGEYIEEQVSEQEILFRPWVIEWEEENYLMYAWTNYAVEIGIILRLTDLYDLFRSSMEDDELLALTVGSGNEKILLNGEGEIEKTGYEILEEPFSTMNISMELLVPKRLLNEKAIAGNRLALYLALVALVLIPILWCAIYYWFLVPMNRISSAMQEILSGNTEYRIQKFSKLQEFRSIEETFNSVLNSNRDLKIQAYELKLEKEKEQLINLKLQINPHLLLNSLTTIASLAVNKKTEEIQEFSINLSKYFRYALRDTSDTVTIQSELEFIKAYNRVQKIRYPNAFYLLFDVEEELMQEKIPPLIIQNFVENSTKYALMPGEEIEILVIVRKQEDRLRVSICDNGRGMEKELLKRIANGEIIRDSRGTHVGIWNCMKRLHNFYGDQVQMKISSEKGKGTQVWIEIPCKTDKEETEDEFADCRG